LTEYEKEVYPAFPAKPPQVRTGLKEINGFPMECS
jgi:hypothetical protein